MAELLSDPAFIDHRVEASRPLKYEASTSGSARGPLVIKTRRTLPTTRIPDAFKRFVGQGIELELSEGWAAPDTAGNRDGELTLNVVGLPAKASGSVALRATGTDSCTLSYSGDLSVSIPLVGGKVEKVAVEAVSQALEVEKRATLEWLNR